MRVFVCKMTNTHFSIRFQIQITCVEILVRKFYRNAQNNRKITYALVKSGEFVCSFCFTHSHSPTLTHSLTPTHSLTHILRATAPTHSSHHTRDLSKKVHELNPTFAVEEVDDLDFGASEVKPAFAGGAINDLEFGLTESPFVEALEPCHALLFRLVVYGFFVGVESRSDLVEFFGRQHARHIRQVRQEDGRAGSAEFEFPLPLLLRLGFRAQGLWFRF